MSLPAAVTLSQDLLDAHELAQRIHGDKYQKRVARYIDILKAAGPDPMEALHSVLKQFEGRMGDGDALLLTAAAAAVTIPEAKL